MTTETNDLILKVLGIILIFFSLRWLKNIFAGKDGKLNGNELGKMAGFIFFLWAGVYIIVKEANRAGDGHLFNDIWLGFVFSGLLTVLHLEAVMDKMATILQLFIQFRTKTITTTQVAESKSEISITKKETTDEPQ